MVLIRKICWKILLDNDELDCRSTANVAQIFTFCTFCYWNYYFFEITFCFLHSCIINIFLFFIYNYYCSLIIYATLQISCFFSKFFFYFFIFFESNTMTILNLIIFAIDFSIKLHSREICFRVFPSKACQ